MSVYNRIHDHELHTFVRDHLYMQYIAMVHVLYNVLKDITERYTSGGYCMCAIIICL